MSTAYVFPGQGSQSPGMGRAFYDAWDETEDRFDELDARIDVDLHELCFGGDRETLRETTNTQPAVFATGVATYAGVADRIGLPDVVAGHSLGHVTATTAAGALDPETGVELVRRRGEAMADAARTDGPGTMTAVLLADPDDVEAACGSREGVSVAGFNAPRQTVVSGRTEAVSHVRSELAERTRARFRELEVGAAFHSPVMEAAVAPFAERLEATPLRPASIPICSDVTGEIYTDPTVARRDLATQLTSPIEWVSVVETLADRGVDQYVAFPPAGTLAGLIGRIAPDADVVALESPADTERIDR